MEASDLTNTLMERAKAAGKSEAQIQAALAEWEETDTNYWIEKEPW